MHDCRHAMHASGRDRRVPVDSPDCRPSDCFGRYDPEAERLTRVEGRVRRAAIRARAAARFPRVEADDDREVAQ